MFDIGWQEIFIVAAIAIIVVGPRDLPRILKTVMSMVRKARSMAREFQSGIDDVVREVELDDLRKEANSIATMDIEGEIKNTLDPAGDLEKDLDMSDIQNDLQDTANKVNTDTGAGETTEKTNQSNDYAGGTETFGGAGPFDVSDVPEPETSEPESSGPETSEPDAPEQVNDKVETAASSPSREASS